MNKTVKKNHLEEKLKLWHNGCIAGMSLGSNYLYSLANYSV